MKNASSALQEVFDSKTIYRASGEEITIIMLGTTENGVNSKIEQLREVAKKYDNVVFAIGGNVVDDCRDVRTALHRADELMYEDKKAYFERFHKKK